MQGVTDALDQRAAARRDLPESNAPAPSVAGADGRARWTGVGEAIWRAGVLVAVTRIGIYALMWAVSYIKHTQFTRLFTAWDSHHYLLIAQHGYPTGSDEIAFFPLLPLAIRLAHLVTTLGYLGSAALVSFVLSWAGATVVWISIREQYGSEAADRAVALVLCFPGAFVLATAFSEALLLPLVAGCLLALRHRKWVVAGVAAGLATATDPAAIVIVVPCALACAIAIKERKEVRSLAALLLAPAGVVAYFAYIWTWSGSPLGWFTAERRGWHTVYWSTFRELWMLLSRGAVTPAAVTNVASLLIAVSLLALAVRWRVDRITLAYGAAAIAIALIKPLFPFQSMARMVWYAFPLIAVVGARWRGQRFTAILAFSALAMAALTVATLGSRPIAPGAFIP